MNFDELFRSLQELWDAKPGLVLLLLLGFVVFVFLVVDAWRHRRHRGRFHSPKH